MGYGIFCSASVIYYFFTDEFFFFLSCLLSFVVVVVVVVVHVVSADGMVIRFEGPDDMRAVGAFARRYMHLITCPLPWERRSGSRRRPLSFCGTQAQSSTPAARAS